MLVRRCFVFNKLAQKRSGVSPCFAGCQPEILPHFWPSWDSSPAPSLRLPIDKPGIHKSQGKVFCKFLKEISLLNLCSYFRVIFIPRLSTDSQKNGRQVFILYVIEHILFYRCSCISFSASTASVVCLLIGPRAFIR